MYAQPHMAGIHTKATKIGLLVAFQTSYIDYRLQLNIPVAGLDAGPDRFSICAFDNTITVAVEYLLGDPFTHSFLWEQVAGTPVTWTTPVSGLVASYTSETGDDKVFRITSDKNTRVERYDEITIFGTPTSLLAISSTFTPSVDVTCRAVTVYYAPYATTIGNLADTTSYELTWTLPTCDVDPHFVEYRVQRKPEAGPWITFAVVGADDPRISYTPNITDVFRILSVYTDDGNQPSNLVYNPNASKSGILTSELALDTIATTSNSIYNVSDLRLISNTTPLSTLALDTIATTSNNIYTVKDLRLISNTTPLSTLALDTIAIPTITYYDVVNLTGGAIGG